MKMKYTLPLDTEEIAWLQKTGAEHAAERVSEGEGDDLSQPRGCDFSFICADYDRVANQKTINEACRVYAEAYRAAWH